MTEADQDELMEKLEELVELGRQWSKFLITNPRGRGNIQNLQEDIWCLKCYIVENYEKIK